MIGNLFFSIQPIALVLTILFTYKVASFFTWNSNNNSLILDGYYSEEESEDENRIRGHLDFYKYYYNETDDSKFENSKQYSKVNNNLEKIKNYVKDTQDVLEYMERRRINFFDLTTNDIDSKDYFYLYEKDKPSDMPTSSTYYLYYYDIQKHILYVANIVD